MLRFVYIGDFSLRMRSFDHSIQRTRFPIKT